MEPQCLSGSIEQPGCAAERYKAKIAKLERALAESDHNSRLREEIRNAAADCDAEANLQFPKGTWTSLPWINLAKRLRAALEKDKS